MKMHRWSMLVACCWLAACAGMGGGGTTSDRAAAEANVRLGAGYIRQGRLDLALQRLERALEQDPRYPVAHSTIAIAYDRLGRMEDAERHYRRATQLDPENAAAANGYAVFLCRQNRWREAEGYFVRAAENPFYPTPEAALSNAGVCARNAGDLDAAEKYLRAALDKDPTFADALATLTEVSYAQGEYLQARAFLQRYRDVREDTAATLAMCVRIEQELRNRAAAEQCAAELRETFPAAAETAQLNDLLGNDARE
ncbi:MAG TPA: type IV pilus biogenesis/stability protein PilW [Gammaproteobacteria bacterium]